LKEKTRRLLGVVYIAHQGMLAECQTDSSNRYIIHKSLKLSPSGYSTILDKKKLVLVRCSIQFSGMIKILYTLFPVSTKNLLQPHTISTSLGSTQPHCNWCAKAIRTRAEWTGAMWNERTCPRFVTYGRTGFKSGLS